ncbi:hypothetical protein PybrP1_012753, partial [[Pythium] brassicae (nom. inval.)]
GGGGGGGGLDTRHPRSLRERGKQIKAAVGSAASTGCPKHGGKQAGERRPRAHANRLERRVLAELVDVAEVGAGVARLVAELLLDAQQLVVLGEALRAARRARLDLAGAQPDRQVRDERVLRLTRPVARHDGPTGLLGHRHGLNALRDRADLVHLEQQRVARLQVDRLLHARRVRDREVVAHNLHVRADLLRELDPRVPVVLVERVLDRHDRARALGLRDEALVELDKLVRRDLVRVRGVRVLKVQVVSRVLAARVELGRRDVHAEPDLVRVPGLLDRLLNQVDCLGVLEDVGREAALVAHGRGVEPVARVDHLLEVVVHLAANLHRLRERRGADREHHELLHRELVARVRAAVDDVERRHRHARRRVAREVRDVLPERHLRGGRAGLAHCERYREDRVRAELLLAPAPLVLRAVELLDHELVELRLRQLALAHERRRDDLVHVLDRLQHALAHVRLATVAQLERLELARGRAARHGRAEEPELGGQVHLDGRVAAGVDDLARLDGEDRHRWWVGGWVLGGRRRTRKVRWSKRARACAGGCCCGCGGGDLSSEGPIRE